MAKFCSSCGSEISESTKFCSVCGASVNGGANAGETVNAVPTLSAQQVNGGGNTANGPKSKMAAGLLGIFLGAFGVHNFYLGYTGKAVAQLLITILSCGFLSFVSAIWGIIEGILVLTGSINTDAKGNQLSD